MNRLIYYSFPVALLAFEAVGVDGFRQVFTPTTRWLLLLVLLAALTAGNRLLVGLQGRFGMVFTAYAAWCIATTAWSQSPQLSLFKSAALVLVAIAFMSAGYLWTALSPPRRLLAYLWPMLGCALVAGIGTRPELNTHGLIYGFSANPNYTGILAAMALPPVLAMAYSYRDTQAQLTVAGVLTLTLAAALWSAQSRASIGCALLVLMGFFAALKIGSRMIIVAVAASLVLVAALAAPGLQRTIYHHVILKVQGSAVATWVLASREDVWAESYQRALQGGYVGAGYGVTIGAPLRPEMSLFTAVGYGVEKGNSQLAIWEETGLIGLSLYALLVVVLLSGLWRGLLSIPDAEARIYFGLLLGVIVGLLAQSVFEAWWTAPGSQESAYFWSAVGAARGVMNRQWWAARRRAPAAVPPVAIGAAAD